MLKNKYVYAIVTLILSVTIILSGCTKNESPKAALEGSMEKSADIKSYNFEGNLKLEELNVPQDDASASEAAAIISMFKNAELSWTGAYQADPMKMDMTLNLTIKGDMAISFSIPIIMTKEKVWVKIPNIPMLPLPETLTNKYLELDLKELAEQSGQTIPTLDVGKSQKMVNDMLAIVFKHVDEETYLSSVKVKDAGLPEKTDVDQVVRFHLVKDQIEPLVNTVITNIAPEILDLLASNEDYRNMLQMSQEDVTKAKDGLNKLKDDEIAKGLEDMKKELTSLDVTANIGMDSHKYPVYTDASIKAALDVDGSAGNIALKVISQMKNINKDVTLLAQPKADEIVTMEQLQEQMGGMFGGMGDADSGEASDL